MIMINGINIDERKLLLDPSTVAGSVTVGVTAVRVMSYNTDRRLAIIANDSVNTLYVGFGPSVSVNSGIRLNALGGTFEFGLYTQFPFLGEIYVIASAANSNVTFVEV